MCLNNMVNVNMYALQVVVTIKNKMLLMILSVVRHIEGDSECY